MPAGWIGETFYQNGQPTAEWGGSGLVPLGTHDFDAMVNTAIASRNAIEGRRRELVGQLARANRRTAGAIKAELQGLSQQERFAMHDQAAMEHVREWTANQNRMESHANALETDRQIRRERDMRIDQQGADAMVKMHELDNLHRSGQITKEQYDDGMLELGQTHFEALHRHPEAAKHWASYLDQNEKMDQYQQRLHLREAAKLQAKYGVPIQVNPDSGEIDFDAMHKAALGTPRGQADALGALNTQMLKQHGLSLASVFEHAAGGRLGNESDPNSFKQTDPNDTQNPQTHVRMTVLSPSGHSQNVIMDKPRFDAIKSQFEPAYNEITSAAASVSPSLSPTSGVAATTVRMRAPDGSEHDVPQNQVAHYQGLGASLVTP